MALPAFLTAYDPSDLPSASIDPLGFERGYLALADQLLPGLTNVANRARYFSVLCAGIVLADVDARVPAAHRYQARLEAVLRLERFWTLANVFAASDEQPADGIRGITYVTRAKEHLEDADVRTTDGDYKLLSRQVTYGMVGTYATVAGRLRLLDRKTFDLTPDLGERLGEAFIAETRMPPKLRAVVRGGGEVVLAKLRDWGERAHISLQLGPVEGRLVFEALEADPTRRRMLELIDAHPAGEEEPELDHLLRLADALADDVAAADLRARILAAHAYEDAYRNIQLAFEHVLERAREMTPPEQLGSSPVLRGVVDRMPELAATLCRRIEALPRSLSERLGDVTELVSRCATVTDPLDLVRALLERHTAVQHGKYDRGRRKGPWLEWSGNRLGLTLARIGRVTEGARAPTDIPPHEYRCWAAGEVLYASAEARAS